jgi:hypothetical protein
MNKNGGGECWPLDDPLITSGSLAGVSRGLTGVYPGIQSGTYYYNQVAVTGTLNPDATGTYTVAGVYGGLPYYSKSGPYYLSNNFSNYFVIGTTQGPANNCWYRSVKSITDPNIPGSYLALGTPTGNATVANVTASGIYLFVPSGVTLQSTGPIVSGEYAKAAAFDGGTTTKISETAWVPSGAFTVAMWVKPTSGYLAFCSFANLLFPSFILNYQGGTYYRPLIFLGSSNWRYFTRTDLVTDGKWHHIAVTVPGNGQNDIDNSAFYVDGVSLAEDSKLKTGTQAARTRIVLGFATTTYTHNGSLAYATVIPAALSATEVYSLWAAATKGL